MASVCYFHLSSSSLNQLYFQSTCRRTKQLYFHNLPSTHFNTFFLSSPTHVCKYDFRDSNAESYTFATDTETGNGDFEVGLAVFEEYIDSIWIFKVFGSYGWISPVILISWLFATGLKAFLITLAIPILQSTFTFAFQKMQGESKTSPEIKIKKTSKTKKRTSSRLQGSKNVRTKEPSVGGNGYGSWSSETNGLLNRNEGTGAEFGGWDELVAAAPRRRSRKSSGVRGGSSGKKSKLRAGWNTNDRTPILLRLLVSIFPFLEFLE